MERDAKLTRRSFLVRGGALLGAAALAPSPSRWLPEAWAAGTFLDEAQYVFDPRSPVFEPDPAVWAREGELAPMATPGCGLGAAGVGSSLAYIHEPPPLPVGLAAGLTAQVRMPPVPDASGAWHGDATSPRLTLDDGVVHAELAWARDPLTGERQLRLENSPAAVPIPFPWDNGYANIVDIHRRPDGLVEVRATNMDPLAADPLRSAVYSPAEIVESDGRIRVQFHWDRLGRTEEDSSCWVRVGHVWAGKAWGMIHIPRIGQEVVVEFLESDPDRPIIIGSVYNAEQMPPYPLPVSPAQDGLKSRTSSGRGTLRLNEIRFEDKKGSEELFIHRERDGNQKLEAEMRAIEPPFVWSLRLEERNLETLFPLVLVQQQDVLVASYYLELQIGDMTGSQLFRLIGPRRRRRTELRAP